MPRQYNKATGSALITFVNECFPLDPKLEKITDLIDGFALNKILITLLPNTSSSPADIDVEYAVHDLEKITSPSVWLANKKRLEAVYKSLQRYLRDNPDCFGPINLDGPVGLNAIAEHNDAEEATKVGEDDSDIIHVAAIKGPSNEKYIPTLINLQDKVVQEEVAKMIQLLQPDVQDLLLDETDAIKTLSGDLDLAAEEAHAKLQADFDLGKKRHADLVTRLEYLQYAHDELQQFNAEANDRIRELEKAQLGDQTEHIQSLKHRIQEDEDLIANQEQQLETARVLKENQARELQKLRPLNEKVTALQDELSEVKNQNDILTRKANTADHYQKKLQAQSELESANVRLRQQIDTLQDNQNEFDRVMDENAKLEATMSEYRSRFASYELQFVEINNQKKLLEGELRQQLSMVQGLTASKSHDENFIADLQEQLRTGSVASLAPPSPSIKQPLSLEQELAESDEPEPNYLLEISRLKAEAQLLRGQLGGTTNANLRVELEEEARIRKRYQETLRDLQEKHAVLQQQFNAIISKSDAEKLVGSIDEMLSYGNLQILTDTFIRDEAVAATRKLYIEANQENLALKARLSETQAELSARDRELLEAKSDLVAAVAQDDIDALEELKATHELVTSSFESDIVLLQSRNKNLATDHEQTQSHLVDALLAKDKLSQQIAALPSKADDTKESSTPATPAVAQEPIEVSHITNSPIQTRHSPAKRRSFWQKVTASFLGTTAPPADANRQSLCPPVAQNGVGDPASLQIDLSDTFASMGVILRDLDRENMSRPASFVSTATPSPFVTSECQATIPVNGPIARSSSPPSDTGSLPRPPPGAHVARPRSRTPPISRGF
ncbi:hypothetical protein M7I_5360 [Glarea lozoyensis 74030]|uniref:HOOK N-terminal domain-containing protein n=1 Tax=Glarea lozoyensis (strain ATCC 74030 / MF5533) TaxID=1104152 RepID=H0ERN9_GLAL7|nr:hypothetical protein M7I_5360 [Glarea lozoyensis 74030]